jgi:uncharacterized protein
MMAATEGKAMLLRAIVVCLLLPLAALAQETPAALPQPLSDTVSDHADLLPPEAEAAVSQRLAAARAETGVHVVLVTLPSLAEHGGAGERIEDYAKRLFNAWGVGDGTRNDGVMILVSPGERAMRIALGDAFGPVWDGAAQRAIDTAFLPAFREGRWAEGLTAGVEETLVRVVRPFAEGRPSPLLEPDRGGLMTWVMLGLAALATVAIVLHKPIARAVYARRPCPRCGAPGLRRDRHVLIEATVTAEGRGETVISCPHCGHEDRKTYPIARVDSDDERGGFGGGQSSGGGATGRW